jgi:hypothetical protein
MGSGFCHGRHTAPVGVALELTSQIIFEADSTEGRSHGAVSEKSGDRGEKVV